MALRDEVEQEYADRMEELRNMYKNEMDTQNEKFTKEREKGKQLEMSLSDSLKLKREEADTFKSRANEFESRVEELARRLDNQTAEVIRLTAELEEYEYGGGNNGGMETPAMNNEDDGKEDEEGEEEDGEEESEYEEAE